MSNNDILLYGHSILREPALPVLNGMYDQVMDIKDRMLFAVKGVKEIALAANQVGERLSIVVADMPTSYDLNGVKRINPDFDLPLVLLNAVITSRSEGTNIQQEGCLSFPKLNLQIERSYEIEIDYAKFECGKLVEKHSKAKGFLARVLQHEIDHLKGVLFIDHISDAKKFVIKDKLKRIRKESSKQ